MDRVWLSLVRSREPATGETVRNRRALAWVMRCAIRAGKRIGSAGAVRGSQGGARPALPVVGCRRRLGASPRLATHPGVSTWFDVPGMDRAAAERVYLENVADVVRNYRTFGVRHLVFAGALRDRGELGALEAATAMSLRVEDVATKIIEWLGWTA